MGRPFRHIYALVSAALCLAATVRTEAGAQELMMKEAWDKALVSVPSLYRADTLSICFMGDVMMHSEQIRSALRADGTYDFTPWFSLISDRIAGADLAVANMEFTLAGEPYTGYPCFSAPYSFADHLADVGFDIFLAANNHIFDKGSEGAARTVEEYRRLEKERGIMFTGLAESQEARDRNTPLMVLRKGIRLAFINMTYGTNLGMQTIWPKTNYIGEKNFMSQAFEAAEEKGADMIIALPHWGPEYELGHSKTQEETAGFLIENGADLIIGAHPHVVQDISCIGEVPVAYSLGNAVSNMSAPNTQVELMVTLKIARQANGDLKMLPLELTWLWCSRPGGFGKDYTVIPIEEYIGRHGEWIGAWDYDKMITTYERVKNNHK